MTKNSLQLSKFLQNAEKFKNNKIKEYLKITLTFIGLFGIMLSLLAENYSTQFFLALQLPTPFIIAIKLLFFAAKAFIFIEAFGYFLHRFFEHIGFMTRYSGFIRRNQQFHWTHHMIMYPLGENYIKGEIYKTVPRPGTPWFWIIPAMIAVSAIFLFRGITWESLTLFGIMICYGKIIELTHYRFHLAKHPWITSKYFQWISDIHILHHFDQARNYTITNPIMDMVFGTYLSPKGRIEEIKKALLHNDISTSDLINWNYLLMEARPSEYAVYVSAAQKYPGILIKVKKLMHFLKEEVNKTPENKILKDFFDKTQLYLGAVSEKTL